MVRATDGVYLSAAHFYGARPTGLRRRKPVRPPVNMYTDNIPFQPMFPKGGGRFSAFNLLADGLVIKTDDPSFTPKAALQREIDALRALSSTVEPQIVSFGEATRIRKEPPIGMGLGFAGEEFGGAQMTETNLSLAIFLEAARSSDKHAIGEPLIDLPDNAIIPEMIEATSRDGFRFGRTSDKHAPGRTVPLGRPIFPMSLGKIKVDKD